MNKEPQQLGFFANCKQLQELAAFDEFGQQTICETLNFSDHALPVFINEFWTSKQRVGHPLHEISYRACFKPQLPRFFIERLTGPGDVVYDPFMGRGTTLLEAALLGREVVGCDINPLSERLVRPRLELPELDAVEGRLGEVDLTREICGSGGTLPSSEGLEGMAPSIPHDGGCLQSHGSSFSKTSIQDLLTFYHPETLRQILALRAYLEEREQSGEMDAVDRWIRMVATNRLTGHSSGFFSVYTMPPNQAVSIASQERINAKRKQSPPLRDVKSIILKKSRSLLRNLSDTDREVLQLASERARYLTKSCAETSEIVEASVDLVVTSPPFLDVVDYQSDNWLRGWFNHIDTEAVPVWQLKNEEDWVAAMNSVFSELYRVLKRGGHIAFEVGEVRNAKIKMETLVLRAASDVGLIPEFLLINTQEFTKTANCWGVSNGTKGTNTNRVIVFQKP